MNMRPLSIRKKTKINIPMGEVKGHETPKPSKEEAIENYLNFLHKTGTNKNEKELSRHHYRHSEQSDLPF